MTEIDLAYGPGRVRVSLPASVTVETVEPPVSPRVADERAVVEAALDAPHASPRLEDLARGRERVVVVVPDATRAARTPVALAAVLARLRAAGVRDDARSVLVARGIHEPPSPSDLERILGDGVPSTIRVDASAPDDPAANADLPPDRDVERPRVHRSLVKADLVVLTGAVAPHYLAGCSGGPKGVVPGCADRDTVAAAHRLTLDSTVAPDGSLRSRLGRPEGNPFRDALLRIARSLRSTFSIDVGLGDGRIAHASSGEIGEANDAAWREHRARFAAERPEPADLVIAGGGAPRDRDLVQAHKTLVVASEVARPGAPIVWLAHAGDGPGHPRFLPWFEAGRLERHLAALRRQFHPYGLTAYALRWKAARHPVHVVSTQSRDVLRPMGLLAFSDAQAAVDYALAHHRVVRCVVLPCAAETFW